MANNSGRWNRTIVKTDPAVMTELNDWPQTNLADVLAAHAVAMAPRQPITFLLAHAEDGLIWAKGGANGLTYAPALSPKWREERIWQVRLFGLSSELFAWRDGANHWRARRIEDVQGMSDAATYTESFDEAHVLWGTTPEPEGDFTVMSDGAQGLRHCVPVAVAVPKTKSGSYAFHQRPLRLDVRHYVTTDNDGAVRIATSRLLQVRFAEQEKPL